MSRTTVEYNIFSYLFHFFVLCSLHFVLGTFGHFFHVNKLKTKNCIFSFFSQVRYNQFTVQQPQSHSCNEDRNVYLNLVLGQSQVKISAVGLKRNVAKTVAVVFGGLRNMKFY